MVEGEVHLDGKILVIRHIRVSYRLELERKHRATARRAHETHVRYCPVARTLSPGVTFSTYLEFVDSES